MINLNVVCLLGERERQRGITKWNTMECMSDASYVYIEFHEIMSSAKNVCARKDGGKTQDFFSYTYGWFDTLFSIALYPWVIPRELLLIFGGCRRDEIWREFRISNLGINCITGQEDKMEGVRIQEEMRRSLMTFN